MPTIIEARKLNNELKNIQNLQIEKGLLPSFKTATEAINYTNKPNLMDFRLARLINEIAQAISKAIKGKE